MSASYVELSRPQFGQRWLFELSEPVRYTTGYTGYATGDLETVYVVVSWGRDGDTCIFPSDDAGTILDMLGFKSWGHWENADAAMDEWLEMSSVATS
jgi:hypothetical protein